MASPLDTVARTVSSAFSGVFYDATLSVDTPTAGGDPFDPPAPTATTYSCKALVDTYSERWRREGLVEQNDRRVMILGDTLAVDPKAGNRLTMNAGPNAGETLTLIDDAMADPAQAVWTVRGRN